MAEPGIYTGVPFDEYLKWDGVSNTILKIVRDKSPMHAKYFQDNPLPSSPTFLQGQAAHTMALEPDKFNERYAIMPECDRRTKEGKEIYFNFESQAGDKVVLTKEQADIARIIASTLRYQIINRFIEQGEAEVCIVWIDKKTGLLCKARLDYVHRGRAIIIDLKSTEDASPKGFQRSLSYYRYYQQAAFYCEGWKILTGDDSSFVFLPVEKSPPYACAAYEMHDDAIQAGKLEFQKALEIYSECLKNNHWTGYGETVEMMTLPQYQLKELGINQYQIRS